MTITYHTSRSAAREYAQNNGGKVVDNGPNWSNRLLEPETASRWSVYSNDENVIGVTVKVSKDREEKGTHSIPASEVYGMMDRMLPDTYKVSHKQAYPAAVHKPESLPANARILVSRNKREGKAFVKMFGTVYVRGKLGAMVKAIRKDWPGV